MLNAGHETTTNLIGNGLVTLSANPAEKQRLIAQPELIKTAVEEMLAFREFEPARQPHDGRDGRDRRPVAAERARRSRCASGPPIAIPRNFPSRNDSTSAARRTGIWRSPSACINAPAMALARLEGAIAISRYLARFPRYALDGEPVRGGRVRFRGYLSVPCLTRN